MKEKQAIATIKRSYCVPCAMCFVSHFKADGVCVVLFTVRDWTLWHYRLNFNQFKRRVRPSIWTISIKKANKKCWKKLFFFFIIQIELVKITPMNIDPPRPIQILIPENHSFRLNSKELQPIFENENIKNRQLFIVSIAGPHRQGKSFLMSFFIRFLNAQVNWKKKKKMQFYKWTAKKKLPKPKPNGEFCRFFFSNVPIFLPLF